MKMINVLPVLLGLTVLAFAFGAEVDGPQEGSHPLRQQASSEDSKVSQPPVAQPRPDQRLFDGIDFPVMDAKLHRRRRQSRIVGGDQARQGQFPWQARIRLKREVKHQCGGTILNEDWILSAAHCAFDSEFWWKFKETDLTLVVGDNIWNVQDEGEQDFSVEKMILHPGFNKSTTDNDIALLKVRRKDGLGIIFNQYVQPACLPQRDTPYSEGLMCNVSGWGYTRPSRRRRELGLPRTKQEVSTVLRWVSVPLVSDGECRKSYRDAGYVVTPQMVCAGYHTGGKDSCGGDSGGPLVCNIKGLHTVMGVVSWGKGCAQGKYPGVYAKVTEFLPWICENIRTYSASDDEQGLPEPCSGPPAAANGLVEEA